MTILIKLGGSLVTDKNQARTFRKDATARIVRQIKQLFATQNNSQLIIGHGSGSFGHFEAQRHRTIAGVSSGEDWLGFTKVGEAALALSQLVLREFVEAGLPVVRFQPSTLITAANGQIAAMEISLIIRALKEGLIPLVHGDIAFDTCLGGTIASTESIFVHLAKSLPTSKIILLGEVDGVLASDGHLIKDVTPRSLHRIRSSLSGSSGVDVTGGMLQKVEEMVSLVVRYPQLQVVIANGHRANVLVDLLQNGQHIGTRIRGD